MCLYFSKFGLELERVRFFKETYKSVTSNNRKDPLPRDDSIMVKKPLRILTRNDVLHGVGC